MPACFNCQFILDTYPVIESNREYWQMTEVFVKLHNGNDFCNFNVVTGRKSDVQV